MSSKNIKKTNVSMNDNDKKSSKNNEYNTNDNNIKSNINIDDNDSDLNNNQLNKIITSNIHIPYINKSLSCPIMLLPDQMDNKMYIHLKSNLKNKLESKCYKNYGYVNKIYSIEEISDGVVEAEDPSCSCKIIVKFTCNLCLPINGKEIICKIDRMNKTIISAINGPIKAIITTDKINKDNFYSDMDRNIKIKGSTKNEILVPGKFIRVLVQSKSFSDYDSNILVIAYLENIASQEQIDQYFTTENIDTEINEDFK